jgi:hypothetical protein
MSYPTIPSTYVLTDFSTPYSIGFTVRALNEALDVASDDELKAHISYDATPA